MKHALKIDEVYLKQLLSGEKTFEVRINDRGYNKGDILTFHNQTCFGSHNHDRDDYQFEITYVHSGLGLKEGYVALAVKQVVQ